MSTKAQTIRLEVLPCRGRFLQSTYLCSSECGTVGLSEAKAHIIAAFLIWQVAGRVGLVAQGKKLWNMVIGAKHSFSSGAVVQSWDI